MMNKDMLFHHQQQQQQQVVMEENMSNLTSASGDQASVSSGTRTEASGTNFVNPPPHHHQQQQQQYFVPQTQSQPSQPPKKKRNQPGNPDPEAEVIALSPKTLMATNRFICEICGKGFQRDQNLQLHRRGHNLPWKLKQRANKDVIKKKVYVCPEASCVHHEPSRALGDLTGIKKHFCRKHGEKKWKCDKCSKRYAVQSDWKAHSKTCGTKEYRCDCGTLFSRRDSFITHRAFCDALAEESARTIPTQPSNTNSSSHNIINLHIPQSENSNHSSKFNDGGVNNNNSSNDNNSSDSNTLFSGFPMKKEQQSDINYNTLSDLGHHHHHVIPPWLAPPPMPGHGSGPPPASQSQPHSSPPLAFSLQHELTASNSNPSGVGGGLFPLASAATAGASAAFHQSLLPPMSATALLQKAAQMGATMTAPSLTDQRTTMAAATMTSSVSGFGLAAGGNIQNPSLFQDYMINSAAGFDQGETFDETFGGFLRTTAGARDEKNGGSGGGVVGEGLTRDFLGLRPLSHSDILSFASLGNCINNTASEQQKHSHSPQKPWQG